MEYLLRGILIGILFGLPVGAIGALTVQRTWSLGAKAGLLTGLGLTISVPPWQIVSMPVLGPLG